MDNIVVYKTENMVTFSYFYLAGESKDVAISCAVSRLLSISGRIEWANLVRHTGEVVDIMKISF